MGCQFHFACKSRSELDVVKYLESLYPESIYVCNDIVGLPLHCAERKDVFQHLFFERYNGSTRPPLHSLFQDDSFEDKTTIAKRFIDIFPANARDIDSHGATALHFAVTTPTTTEFIDKLIELSPDAITTQDSQGSLPLHKALRSTASPDIIRCLLLHNGHSAHVVDHLGRTPLHVACRHGAPLEVVADLNQAHAQGIHALDSCRCTPLHVACRHGAPLDVVQRLVELDERTLQWADENQELPLHKACRGGHTSLVQHLVNVRVALTSRRNASGVLPVFLLCQSSGKSRDNSTNNNSCELVETIWLLLRAHPEALQRFS